MISVTSSEVLYPLITSTNLKFLQFLEYDNIEDFRIEKDFISVIKDQNIDFFVNRIHCYFPLTSENLIKMSSTVTKVSEDILPNEKLDCVAYGCTSGTVAAGYESIKEKVNLAKPEAQVTTPITSTIKALKKLNIKKISVFTPYTQSINNSVIDYFKKSGIKFLDYKDANYLLKLVNEQGKILPRRLTGTSAKFQGRVNKAIKRARHLALMPYVGDMLK